MQFLVIFNQSLVPLLLIVAIAVLYQRYFQPDIRQMATLALNIFVPLLVFDSLTRHQTTLPELWQPFGFMVLLTSCMLLLGWLGAFFLRLNTQDRTSFILACSMVNIGNFGLPLIYFTFGQEAVPISVIIFVVFNIPLSTLAIFLSSDKGHTKDMLIDVLKFPIFQAMVVALCFTSFGWQLPSGLAKGVHLMAQGAIPLLIFVLGLQLATISLSRDWAVYAWAIIAAIAIRLLASPLAADHILALFSFSTLEHNAALVQTSGPSAILPLMYAIKFKRSPELLAALIFSTTVVSGISLPLVISLLSG
ncbi:MAG: AEC family transporter [Desulfovermiculus sp.]